MKFMVYDKKDNSLKRTTQKVVAFRFFIDERNSDAVWKQL